VLFAPLSSPSTLSRRFKTIPPQCAMHVCSILPLLLHTALIILAGGGAGATLLETPFPTTTTRHPPVPCGRADINTFYGPVASWIRNGNESSVRRWPWTVYLRNHRGSTLCTGSVVSPWHVLTAAHCLCGVGPIERCAGADLYLNATAPRREGGMLQQSSEVHVPPHSTAPPTGVERSTAVWTILPW
jgi:Trypsin